MNNDETATVILLGASTRAAALSARRAGWTPWCADLFADSDLERIATVHRVPSERYPQGLIDALADAPPGPVIYTGALENRPELIAQIERPLWGNPPDVLRAVRDPLQWTQALIDAGLPCPVVSLAAPSGGRWLHKPCRSGGGIGIAPYAGGEVRRGTFLQQWLDGDPVSGLFLGCDDGAILIGVTRQLVGTPWLNAAPFHYAGNIGPLPHDHHWQRIGAALVARFRLRGIFGVDAILCDGVPWPIEINPRYTASVEVFERALGIALLPLHRDCFLGRPDRNVWPHDGQIVGKAAIYARRTFAFPPNFDDTDCADVPHANQVIGERHPVLTLFARGDSVDDCANRLREKGQALDRELWG